MNRGLVIKLIVSFLGIFLFPVLCLAFVSTGQECQPSGNRTGNQACSFCNKNNGKPSGEKLHLAWQINNANFKKPFCSVTCRRTDGQSCSTISRKDSNQVATSTFPAISNWWENYNLKPIDDVFVPDDNRWGLKPGNIYQTSCCELSNQPTLLHPCLDNTSKLSGQITITSCSSCQEIQFGNIVQGLDALKPQLITETNFDKWAQVDNKDWASYPSNVLPGSGNKSDIGKVLVSTQCTNVPKVTGDMVDAFPVVNYLKKNSGNRDAFPLVLALLDPANSSDPLDGYHAVVGLNFKETAANSKKYELTVLDPNGPAIKKLEAEIRQVPITPGVFTLVLGSSYTTSSGVKLVAVLNPEKILGNFLTVAQLKSGAVRTKTADWLSSADNYPKIDNNESQFGDGVCGGWSDFVLKVAYFGNFEGRDCHPDGTITKAFSGEKYSLAAVYKSIINIFSYFGRQ